MKLQHEMKSYKEQFKSISNPNRARVTTRGEGYIEKVLKYRRGYLENNFIKGANGARIKNHSNLLMNQDPVY